MANGIEEPHLGIISICRIGYMFLLRYSKKVEDTRRLASRSMYICHIMGRVEQVLAFLSVRLKFVWNLEKRLELQSHDQEPGLCMGFS